MNSISRSLSGGVCLLLGLILGYNSFISENNFWTLLIYGIILMVLGIFILFNKKEDEIEQIKTNNLKVKASSKKKGKKK
jgi:uncharacterized membrane protein HdeD (DUF308 family)